MKLAYFVAGGTGGHILPALSLGKHFKKSLKYKVRYVSGRRHLDYKLYGGEDCIHLKSYALVGKSFDAVLKSIIFNSLCFFQMLFKFIIIRPKFVFGAGGYVCGPTLLAAKILFIPVFVLEQNSVMGLTNKILSRVAKKIFLNFKGTKGLPEGLSDRVAVLGNPVREEFLGDMRTEQSSPRFRILVTGGSLGAQGLNQVITEFLKSYEGEEELEILHQIGKNESPVQEINSAILYKQTEYIDNMAKEIRNSDFIVCRGGATTVTELKYAKTPCLIVPTPLSIHRDKHQVFNGESLKAEAEFPVYVITQEELSEKPNLLNKIINEELQRDRSEDISWHLKVEKNPTLLIAKSIEESI